MLLKIGKFIGFNVYHRSYLLGPPVIVVAPARRSSLGHVYMYS